MLGGIGGFGALFRLDLQRWKIPILVSSSADGVGTKLKIAFELGMHHTVGADLVNHCVNDIAVQGATPLFFLDYLATGSCAPRSTRGGHRPRRGLQGQRLRADRRRDGADARLLRRRRVRPGGLHRRRGRPRQDHYRRGIEAGDVLIGLPSTGLHTNGYSLARKLLFEVAGYTPDHYVNALKDKAGAALMKTHRSYLASSRSSSTAGIVARHGAHHRRRHHGEPAAHSARGTARGRRSGSWPVPPLFEHLQELGNVTQDEMMRTFNMGIGMIVVVPAEQVKKAKAVLNRANERYHIIGRITRGDRRVSYN